MKIGYARVSTKDQKLRMQTDALKKEGCEQIFTDKCTGIRSSRPGFDEMLKILRRGDEVIVWKMDRIGRSVKHLVNLIDDFHKKGITLRSLNDPIDTSTESGRLLANLFAFFAEFERNLTSERTKAGLKSARARGKVGGRPRGIDLRKAEEALTLYYNNLDLSIRQICKFCGISRGTLYHWKKMFEQDSEKKVIVHFKTLVNKPKRDDKKKYRIKKKKKKRLSPIAREAVELYNRGELKTSAICEKYEIKPDKLYRWKKKYNEEMISDLKGREEYEDKEEPPT